ncbi:MAG: S28 family serine protease [Polaribacter sp.]|nr:S28 family serine protease [Polaribacter sp.]
MESNLEGLSFKEQLKVLFPSAEINAVKAQDHSTEAYQLILKQSLNHQDASAGTFDHYIYVSHAGYEKPTVLVTEGYNARYQTYELSEMLRANQVQVEYRFYGKSRPDSIPWQYLKNDAAVEDYHKIVTKLKRLYTSKWLSAGISKGGETVLIYKSKYPKDIDVAVPYVAPLINTQEDPRTIQLINTVGTKECRDKIVQFQRAVLKNGVEVLEELKKYAAEKKVLFTKMPVEEVLEHAVLEFPFSFWQWGSRCEEIPNATASSVVLFAYLKKVAGFYLFSDAGIYNYLPSFYQHMTELGYYGYDTAPVQDLLVHIKTSSLACFGPENIAMPYDTEYIREVRDFIENKGHQILYIYGEYDPWGACAPIPKPTVDALKMVLKGGHHGTRIKHFSKDDQQKIHAKLQDWLGKEIELFPIN